MFAATHLQLLRPRRTREHAAVLLVSHESRDRELGQRPVSYAPVDLSGTVLTG